MATTEVHAQAPGLLPNEKKAQPPGLVPDMTPGEAAAAGIGWVPSGHPLYGTPGYVGYGGEGSPSIPPQTNAQPPGITPTPATPASGGPAMTPAEAAKAGLGWVPQGHPLYGTPGYVGSTPGGGAAPGAPGTGVGGTGYTPPNSAPGTPGTDPINTQAKNAQTYSNTPGAAPTDNTTNQGSQDTYRNMLLQRATQGTAIDANDPAIRAQSDAFRAQQSRAARELMTQQAESGGPLGQAFAQGQQRATAERAGQAAGAFEAQLIGNELQQRRQEIQTALSELGGAISNDQKMKLQRDLAALDAELKRLGISTSASTAAAELALKEKLGLGGLNVDLMRALLQNQQFGNELGFNIAEREAFWNNEALKGLF